MTTRNKSGAFILILLFLLSPLLPLVEYFSGNWYSILHGYSIGMVFGIFAYGYFLNTLILSTRLPVFDRIFGQDRVMVLHGYLAVLALLFAGIHAAFKISFYFAITRQTVLGIASLAIFAAVIAVTLTAMVSGRLQRISSMQKLRTWLTAKTLFDYSKLKLFHNLTSVAALLAAIHVFMAYSTKESQTRMAIMNGWAGTALALYIWHKFIRPILLRRKSWTVTEVNRLGPGIAEISMERNAGNFKGQKAGQFAYFRFLSSECGMEEHPFTIASRPGSTSLSIIFKELGDYTAKLKNIKPGTTALVNGPYGLFTPLQKNPLLFIAGGIGITPFRAILQEWTHSGIEAPTVLIWSCRNADQMIHREFFEECDKLHDNFTFVPVLTGEGGQSRIEQSLLEKHIDQATLDRTEVFICGPDSLNKACATMLTSIGIHKKNIRYEKFG
jgi:predicted ferric reductase